MERLCQTCGGSGSADCMVTCSTCRQVSEHIFCMQIILRPIPKLWCCEGCSDNPSEDGSGQISEITDSSILEAYNSDSVKTNSNNFEVLGALITSIREKHKKINLLGDLYDSTSKNISSTESMTVDYELHDTHGMEEYNAFVKPCDKCPSKVETRKGCEIDKTIDDSHDMAAVPTSGSGIAQQLKLLMDPDSIRSDMCWEGTFHASDTNFQYLFGVYAHLHGKVSYKASEISKNMDVNLNLNIVPRLRVWPKQFEDLTNQDIALYFFPCKNKRSEEKYMHLMKYINSNDYALQSHIDNVELLIYSSKQLSTTSESTAMYLWGVFRKVKRKSLSHTKLGAAALSNFADHPNNSNEKKLKENDRLSGSANMMIDGQRLVPVVDASLGIPNWEDANQVTLDVPPGFSRLPAAEYQINDNATGVLEERSLKGPAG